MKGDPWTEKVLHNFAGIEMLAVAGDGGSPNGSLILDSVGNIYGTTSVGGFNCPHSSQEGCGTVFELAPNGKDGTWREVILHVFEDIPDGRKPFVGLVTDGSGNLYGTTFLGGNEGSGALFRLAIPQRGDQWVEDVLFSWSGSYGYQPSGPPLIDLSHGLIYLTATGGGTSKGGTLSELRRASDSITATAAWVDTVLYNFSGKSTSAAYPYSKLVPYGGGLYGNSLYGGSGPCQGGCGTVYKAWP